MKNFLPLVVLHLWIGFSSQGYAAGALPRSAPEAQGVSSAALLELVNALDQVDGMHSLIVVRHGQVVAEGWWNPYDAEHQHVLYSLSKSFTSTAVGFAAAEGKLGLDDEVLKFFPDDAPEKPSNNLKAMRVRDLLMMSTGHQDEPSSAADVVSPKSFLAQAVPHLPGTHFKYNTAATFMQSAIVQKVTGQTVLEYLQSRLFGPLGIEHPVWETNFQGVSLGGYGLRVRTEDIAKLGQLYLQRGSWKGQQLLPAEWVALATAKQTSNGSNPKSDWNQGYGFQFWRCRHNAYRGDGAFGQYCVVMPDQDVVVAITSGVRDMQGVLNILWDKLLPGLQAQPLPANTSTHTQLKERLAKLQVPPAQGSLTSPSAQKFLNRKFVFAANDQKLESLILASSDGGKTVALTTSVKGKETTIPCAHRAWAKGQGGLDGGRLAQFTNEPVAGTFAWSADNTCVIKSCAVQTPFHLTSTLDFEGDQVTYKSESNVGFGATRKAVLVGKAE